MTLRPLLSYMMSSVGLSQQEVKRCARKCILQPCLTRFVAVYEVTCTHEGVQFAWDWTTGFVMTCVYDCIKRHNLDVFKCDELLNRYRVYK